ncbi:hypothetical protein SRABI118_00429 [Massilia sp. Bi118]|uniref:SDR family oxidoreductase n=1 Tax=Massilia sp. Bi118 TaxID=2822346 RepID=UPI001D275BE3|nr:SDR family oxidoreductase [Massilia sp. Bi118]CAH0146903.1 hypothetical protein SRABI118_00429 [Massilia sp. Bi118]
MKIVVIGGTGLIGSKLVSILRERGHEAIAASPNSGVNTITGEGLDQALANTDVVVDVANSPSFADEAVMEFFTVSGRNLLAAAARAGVKHHVALSVVGTDRLAESGYFRAKIAQEKLIRESGLPYTIVHSTQFFEFLGGIAASAGQGDAIALSPAFVQPISSDDVAIAMAECTLGAPVNGIVEIAGPDRFRLAELVQQYLAVKQDPRTVQADVHARYFGAELKEDTLVPHGEARLGAVRLQNWLRTQAPAH